MVRSKRPSDVVIVRTKSGRKSVSSFGQQTNVIGMKRESFSSIAEMKPSEIVRYALMITQTCHRPSHGKCPTFVMMLELTVGDGLRRRNAGLNLIEAPALVDEAGRPIILSISPLSLCSFPVAEKRVRDRLGILSDLPRDRSAKL